MKPESSPAEARSPEQILTDLASSRDASLRKLVSNLLQSEVVGVDDIMQEALLRSWRHFGQLRTYSEKHVIGWVLKTARRLVIDGWRHTQSSAHPLTMDVEAAYHNGELPNLQYAAADQLAFRHDPGDLDGVLEQIIDQAKQSEKIPTDELLHMLQHIAAEGLSYTKYAELHKTVFGHRYSESVPASTLKSRMFYLRRRFKTQQQDIEDYVYGGGSLPEFLP